MPAQSALPAYHREGKKTSRPCSRHQTGQAQAEMTRGQGQGGCVDIHRGNGDREGVGEVEKIRDMAETSNANGRDSWKVAHSGLSPGRGAGGT